jgi:hypothetical protein
MSTATLAGNGHAPTNGHGPAEAIWPFGRFAGQRLSEINTGYLRWVLQGEGWDEGLRADVADELARREHARKPPKLDRVLDRWRRKLEYRYADDPAALDVIAEAAGLLDAMLHRDAVGEGDR